MRRRPRTARAAVAAALGLALQVAPVAGSVVLLSGCAGPHADRNVSAKGVPVDVVLGAGKEQDAINSGSLPPARATNPVPTGFPGAVQPPLPPTLQIISRPDQLHAVRPVSFNCPAPDVLAAPRLEAKTYPDEPPQAATYVFKTNGTFTLKGKTTATGTYPALTTRTVANPHIESTGQLPDGTPYSIYTFDVVAPLGLTTTTTHYRVVTNAVGACVPNGSSTNPLDGHFCDQTSPAGIYIAGVDTKQADGTTDSFTPAAPGVQLVMFPLQKDLVWHSTATDPTTGVTETINGHDLGKPDVAHRVFACAAPLDSWLVHIDGTISSGTSDLKVTGTLNIAPQFGGLSVADDLTTTGTQDNVSLTARNRSVVTREPLPAKAPTTG